MARLTEGPVGLAVASGRQFGGSGRGAPAPVKPRGPRLFLRSPLPPLTCWRCLRSQVMKWRTPRLKAPRAPAAEPTGEGKGSGQRAFPSRRPLCQQGGQVHQEGPDTPPLTSRSPDLARPASPGTAIGKWEAGVTARSRPDSLDRVTGCWPAEGLCATPGLPRWKLYPRAVSAFLLTAANRTDMWCPLRKYRSDKVLLRAPF